MEGQSRFRETTKILVVESQSILDAVKVNYEKAAHIWQLVFYANPHPHAFDTANMLIIKYV